MTAILGISAFYHDSAAALVIDGEIVAAAQEERFSRRKHDAGFPRRAVAACLAQAGMRASELDHVGFYEKPLLKFDRLMETYLSFAPSGFWSFRKAMPEWAATKLQLRREIRRGLRDEYDGRICFCEHHQSHAASAFFPSPMDEAAILVMDGVGEWATTSLGAGRGNRIELTDEIHFPHSLGLLYSAFTYYTGFQVNADEYKLMGLAPFGQPHYADLIRQKIISIAADGSYRLDMQYFNYCQGLTMTSARFDRLFGRRPRRPSDPIDQLDMDLAASVQQVTEEVVLKAACYLHDRTQLQNLCFAGGVALNCVANGRLCREGPFDRVWIQPAAGDAGGALGTALWIWHQLMDRPRRIVLPDHQAGSLLGPTIDPQELPSCLDRLGAVYERFDDPASLDDSVVTALVDGNVVGVARGPMEFGPRALGNRSILADARRADMQSVLNQKIKFRESFRPFAPAVLAERVSDHFDWKPEWESPYMLIVSEVADGQRVDAGGETSGGLERVKEVRSTIPAVTHVDYSARLQTVDGRHPALQRLLRAFDDRTGCPLLVNTSFNVRDEPIVCTAEDALRCFLNTEMDVLVIEDCLLRKQDQLGIDRKAFEGTHGGPSEEADSRADSLASTLSISLALCVLAAVAAVRWEAEAIASVLAGLGIVIGALAVLVPATRAGTQKAFAIVTAPLRFLLTVITLAAVYYLVVTPIGLIRRALGHSMQGNDQPSPGWKKCQPRELESCFRTY